jgi:hypothetical protein
MGRVVPMMGWAMMIIGFGAIGAALRVRLPTRPFA